MTSRVVSVSPSTAIPEVIRLMVDNGVSGVPVVDDGELVGIVTEADIVSREIELDPPAYGTFLDAVFKLPWDRTDDELRRILATTAGELMSSPVKTLPSSATVRDAASLMYKERVNPVPVLDDSGRMVGIVSRSDVIRLLTEV
jgi:CBS domain-containing protein